jgi:S-adenosylmethionine decarboxylase
MVRVSLPQVSKYVEPELGNEGVSGFVLLEESHISIHVFPSQSYVNIDVFSCGDFDFEKAAKGFQEKLGLTKIKSYVLNRASEMSVKPHISEKLKDSKKWALIS